MRDDADEMTHDADTAEPTPRRIGMMTDVGKKRKVDEDSIMAADMMLGVNSEMSEFRLLVVADGMGGHTKGEVASKIALNSIACTVLPRLLDKTPLTRLLEEGIQNAHKDVLEYVDKNPDASGMGTTAVCALIKDNEIHLANIGDSRAYVVSHDEIRRVTKDHSYVQALVDDGQITEKESRVHPRKNVITKAIGAVPVVEPDIMRLKLDTDEHLLLCCDGVIAHLEDDDIKDVVLDNEDPQEACRRIVSKANKRGGTDNISLVILSAAEKTTA